MTTKVCEDDTAQAIAFSGAVLSTAGYSLVVGTAVLFKEWRNKASNIVWLYMCGSHLLYIYFVSFYLLCKCNHLNENCMSSEIGHALFWMFADYCALTTCSWVLAGAWLAHKRIIEAVNDDFERPPLRLCVITLCTPIPFCLLRFFLIRPPNPLACTNQMFPIPYQIVMACEKVLCLFLHSRILYVVYRGNRDYGRNFLLATSVLALLFVLFSGLQYLLVMIINIVYVRSNYSNIVLLRSITGIVMNGVFFYAIFIFGIRDTRTLWVGLLREKFKIVSGAKGLQ